MAEHVAPGGPSPPPMSRGMRTAVCLELAIVTDQLFALPHWSAVVALVLCVPYWWFCATRSALQYANDEG